MESVCFTLTNGSVKCSVEFWMNIQMMLENAVCAVAYRNANVLNSSRVKSKGVPNVRQFICTYSVVVMYDYVAGIDCKVKCDVAVASMY